MMYGTKRYGTAFLYSSQSAPYFSGVVGRNEGAGVLCGTRGGRSGEDKQKKGKLELVRGTVWAR